MMPKNAYLPQHRAPDWIRLLVAMIGTLALLAACGGNNTPSTSSAPTATTIAQTPNADTSSATPALTPTPAPGSTQIVMVITNNNGSFGFNPKAMTIRVGTIVIWKNMSSAPHTITSDDGNTFDSGTIAVGGTYHFTFRTPGTFAYHCNYHPYMRATIAVV